ncbi:MAG: gamma-glutamyltransferase [Chloroflexi bacterium]|nr:gamma-glutamyltransferase [Chloroflexota bacterium]
MVAILMLRLRPVLSGQQDLGTPHSPSRAKPPELWSRMTLTRGTAMGPRAAIATPHFLATSVGFRVLQDGGNALDAAIAANAMLGVVRPDQCGIGGDLFLLMWVAPEERVVALNASGRAGSRGTPEFVRASGHTDLPDKGPLSVVVPGCVAGWAEALAAHGTRPLGELLQPAIDIAEDGFAVVPLVATRTLREAANFNEAAREVFLPGGSSPRAGQVLRLPEYAESLRTISQEGPRSLYEGALAQSVGTFLEDVGGHLRAADLAEFQPEWVEPARVPFGEFNVHVVPPNSQAILHLMALGILEGVDLGAPLSARAIHLQIEAMRLAYEDRWRIADPAFVDVPLVELLSPEYLARKRERISFDRAGGAPTAAGGDTVFIAAADREGNAVSLIQSLRKQFGSGLVVPGTGIVLNDRARDFGIEAGDPNQIAPGKRPRHTLSPALALRGGRPAVAYGTAGGDVQTFTMLQLSCNLLAFGMGPQEAVDAPRWTAIPPEPGPARARVGLEGRFPAGVIQELESMGYHVTLLPAFEVEPNVGSVANIVQIDNDRGVYLAGADPRADGVALAY